MYEHHSNKEYEKLVTTLSELEEKNKAAKQTQGNAKNLDEAAKIGLIINQANRGIENTITNIATNPMNLSAFAYELRKGDSEDKYSYEFLNGQVRPDILARIIIDNKFKDNEMKPEKTHRVCLGGKSIPLGSLDKNEVYVDENVNDNQIKIKLTPTGFMIINGGDLCLTADSVVEQGKSSKVSWKPITDPSEQNVWLLKPKEKNSDEPYFWIQLGYGDQAPRLVAVKKGGKSQLKVSCDIKDGYTDEERALWKIYPLGS